MAAIDYRTIGFAWLPKRKDPLWWRILAYTGTGLTLLIIAGLLLLFSWLFGVILSDLPPDCYRGTSHLLSAFLYTVVILFLAQGAYADLFLSGDIEFLFTMPLEDAAVFFKKFSRSIRRTFIVLGLMLPFLWAFLFGLSSGWGAILSLPVWMFLCGCTMIAMAALLAFSRYLMNLLYFGLLSVIMAFVLWFFPKMPSYESRVLLRLVREDPCQAYLAWWPSTWIADGIGASSSSRLGDALLAASCCLLFQAVTAVALWSLIRRRYAREIVLEKQSRRYVQIETESSEEKPRIRKQLLERYNSAVPGRLDRYLMERLTPRRRALLRMVIRNETPEKVQPIILRVLIRYGIALMLALSVRLGIDLLSRIDPSFSDLTARMYPMVFAAIFLVAFMVSMAENFRGPPGYLTAQLALMNLRYQMQGAPSLKEQRTGLQSERGDRRHPIQETWPVSFEEYSPLLSRIRTIQSSVMVLLAVPFVLAGPSPWWADLSACGLIAVLACILGRFSAIQQVREYLYHPRRSKVREVFKFLSEASVLVLFLIVVFIAIDLSMPSGAWRYISIFAAYLIGWIAVLSVCLTYLLYRLTRYQYRRRWFDAEYHPYYSNRMY
ncbi:hypothetical protein ACFLU6_03525 [Acidobacteriota bacterium]